VTAEFQSRKLISYFRFLENAGWVPEAAIPSVQAGAVVKGTSEQERNLKLTTMKVLPKLERKIRHPPRDYDIGKEKHLFNFEHPHSITLYFWPRAMIGTIRNSYPLNRVYLS
jgi:hypothetical protein